MVRGVVDLLYVQVLLQRFLSSKLFFWVCSLRGLHQVIQIHDYRAFHLLIVVEVQDLASGNYLLRAAFLYKDGGFHFVDVLFDFMQVLFQYPGIG